MKVKSFIFAIAGLLCLSATALPYWQSRLQVSVSGGGGYTGPGDVVSGAKAWWGLRCYNTAYSGNVADIWDSATGSTTETLLTCSAGGTINQTINSLATTCASGCNIKTLYDQSGALSCSSAACDATQATNANRPTLNQNFNASGHLCGVLNGSAQAWQAAAAFTFPVVNQPYSIASLVERTGNFAATNIIFNENNNGTSFNFTAAGNAVQILAGSASASDSSPHSILTIVNGASSNFFVDGTNTGVSLAATAWGGGQVGIGEGAGGTTAPTTGNICEIGLWPAAFSAGQQTSMHTNQSAWYLTP